MAEDLSREDVHAVVDRAVERILSECKIQAPPVDATMVARTLRLTIQPPRARRDLLARPEPSAEAKQWLAAQAVGDHLKPVILQRLGIYIAYILMRSGRFSGSRSRRSLPPICCCPETGSATTRGGWNTTFSN
jgi:hypothetical protein